MKLFKKAKKGFTLVELVVVIAVIAILAAVSVGAYFGVTESAKNSQALQEGKALHTNLILIANDPADEVCSLGADGLVFESEVDVVKAIAEAAGREEVKWNYAEDNDDTTTTQAYPFIDITKTTKDNDTFVYWLEEGRSVSFNIKTGEQLKN